MSRGWKLGIGIPLALIGLIVAASMGLVLSLFGPDGRLSSPELHASTEGVALVVEDIHIDALPDARETFTQLQARAELEVEDGNIFMGIAPESEARVYLEGARIDVVTEIAFGDVQTQTVKGKGSVEPPGSQDIWVVSTEGDQPLSWTLIPGAWWLVVMNADGSSGVDVTGVASIDIPLLAGFAWVILVVGLGMLAGGVALMISGARTPRKGDVGAPPPPPPTGVARGAPPPRPDTFG